MYYRSFQTSVNIIHELVHRTLISMICAVKPLQTDTCWKWMLSIAGHLVKVPLTHIQVRTCMCTILTSHKADTSYSMYKHFSCSRSICLWSSGSTMPVFSIYHTSEQYFLYTLIGQLGGDQLSIIHLRAAKEKQQWLLSVYCHKQVTLWSATYIVFSLCGIHVY